MHTPFFFRQHGLLALLLLLATGGAQAQAPAFDRAVVCASGDGNYGYSGWGPIDVAVDAQGNTYATGRFIGTIQLGNTLLTAVQRSPGTTMPFDNFVAKLDAAGNYVWAVQMGDNQAARAMPGRGRGGQRVRSRVLS